MTASHRTIGDALALHYAAHGLLPDGGASSEWFHVRMGPITIPLPNPPARRRAVFTHDINHVLTGYDTVLTHGEMQIASFEVGASCGRVWIAWFLNLTLMALAAVMRPRLALRAFVRGRRTRSLYLESDTRSELEAMTVGALRARLGIDDATPPATAADVAAFIVVSASTWVAVLAPPAVTVWLIARA